MGAIRLRKYLEKKHPLGNPGVNGSMTLDDDVVGSPDTKLTAGSMAPLRS
jgi:hypothetical protein